MPDLDGARLDKDRQGGGEGGQGGLRAVEEPPPVDAVCEGPGIGRDEQERQRPEHGNRAKRG